MNRTNKILMGLILGIAAAYTTLSFGYTIWNIFDTSEFAICLFNPVGLMEGPILTAYVNVGDIIPRIWEGYTHLTSYYIDPLSQYLEGKYCAILFISLGFALTIAGVISRPSRDLRGPEGDPQEYLFTSRPRSFLKCIALPWNSILAAWRLRKIPVIIPILLLPFILPFALVMDAFLIVLFAISKGIMAIRIRSASKKDKRSYDENTQYAVCPKCKKRFYQPKVKCKCGLIVEYPVPNAHGIKYHTCNKGHEIPSNNLSGSRSKLDTVCPFCEKDIETHEAKPIVISMVGSLGSGKTTLMLSAVESICAIAKNKGISTEIVTDGISINAQQAKSVTPPTVPGELDTECMFIRSREIPEKEIMFNDISGTEFEPNSSKNLFEEYYKYNNGIIFTIDPLSVMALYNSPSPSKGSKSTPQSAFESFYQMFIEINGRGPSVKSDVPFAAVMTKTDNPRVSSAIREEGSPEAFLRKYGQENFIKIVGSTFTNVKYFEVASLGKDASAIEPFRWIITGCDRDLETKLF